MLYTAEYKHPGFTKISQYYYRELISRNPITATWMGEHSFDGLLPETGADAVERNISFLREMKADFCSLPENELSIDERIDCASMAHFADQQLFMEEDLQQWRMGRDLALCIGDAILMLFVRDFAPLSDRVLSMISRLKAVPVFLSSSKTLFQRVPALAGEIYLESAANLPGFLDTIEKSIAKHVAPVLAAEFAKASLEAKKSLSEFVHWFKYAIMPKATSDWTIGHGAFQALLSVKKLGLTQSEITELAQKVTNEANARIDNLSCIILGVTTGTATGARNEVLKKIKNHGPGSFELSLKAYREAMIRSRAFIEASGFATLPQGEELEILETPEYMKHIIPFSAYIGPEKISTHQRGFYLLTRETSGQTGRYNYANIINSVIHEGYPGHHLQITAQNQHPGSMRSFCENMEIIEGWAAYCQKAVREMGFETSSESLFAHASEEIFNAARLTTDINLQTRAWNVDQATQYLMEQAKIDKTTALIEIKRQVLAPGSQLSSLTGEHLLCQLKNDLKQKFQNNFSNRNFHDLLLYQGSVPIHVARDFYPEIVKHHLKAKNRS